MLLAVTHEGFVAIALQVPPEQLPVQQALPATGQAAPRLRHWALPQRPDTHAPLQQSVLPLQAAVAGAQLAMDDAQVPLPTSQTLEQHSLP